MKVNLIPLDEKVARVLADRRGVDVNTLVSSLIREEAAIEIAGWRVTSKDEASTPITTQPAQPARAVTHAD